MESRFGGSTFRPDVDQSVPETSQAHFQFAQDLAAPFLMTFFVGDMSNKTDEAGDFLWTRLQFKVTRLDTASVSSLEPLRDKWVHFTRR